MRRLSGGNHTSRRHLLRTAALAGAGAAFPLGSAAHAPLTRFSSRQAEPGAPIVIEAPIERLGSSATPSGEQLLRLAGQTQGPETLDPHLAKDLPTAFLLRQIHRGLTRLGPDLEPVLELASRVEISSDRLTYTIALRPEATFHNGRQLTADDVKFSLTHSLNPATAGGDAALLGGPTFLSDIAGAKELIAGTETVLSGVEIVDARTVRINITAPSATFLMKLAAVQAAIIDRNNVASSTEWWREPNGTGPFRLTEWIVDERLTLRRNESYYAGPAPLEQIDFTMGPNASLSFNLYQSGSLDVDPLPIGDVDWALSPRRQLRREVTITQSLGTSYIAFRNDVPPMDDPNIRRAIAHAFPRTRVASLTYNGRLTAATGLIPNGMLGRDWPVPEVEYDLDAARAAIAESAYGRVEDVPTIEIMTSFGGPAETFRDVLRRDLGLDVSVFSADWPQFIDGLSRHRFPAYAWFWGADYPDPENFIWTLFGEGSADNYLDYDNPDMNAIVSEARAESDLERRIELYAEAHELLMADNVVFPIYFDVTYTLAKPYVRGLEVTPLGIIGLESIWLEH